MTSRSRKPKTKEPSNAEFFKALKAYEKRKKLGITQEQLNRMAATNEGRFKKK